MKQALTEIYDKKKQTLKILFNSNNKLLATMYKGLAKDKTIREIHKDIRKVYQMQPIHDIKTLKYCLRATKIAKKYVDSKMNGLGVGGIVLSASEIKQYHTKYAWEFINSKHLFQQTKQISYNYAQKEETNGKDVVIRNALKSDKIYFLASSHSDCAKDHLSYNGTKIQGQLYYNRDFRKIIKDKDLIDEIDKYNREHNLRTFQWVTGRPVWLITRPNCRHYFKQLSINEVFDSTSVKSLIDKYKMHQEVGKRDARQTLYHPTNKKWYKIENIESEIRKYEDRLKFHQAMYEATPCEEIKVWIKKDKELVKDWKAYYRSFTN